MAVFDKNKTIQGLALHKFFVPGESTATGNVQWDTDPDPEFKLDIGSERYNECLEEAHRLKAMYPLDQLDPKNPDQFKEIVRREKAIVTALNDKIHEQYGDYNEAISKGENSATHSSMHNDHARQHTNNPASLGEFKKGELICRQFGPLESALLSGAGMPTFSVGCNFDTFSVKDGKIAPVVNTSGQKSNAHITVISRLTGNIIEATTDSSKKGGEAYQYNVNGVSIDEIVAGKTVISASGPNQFEVYSTGFFNGPEQHGLVEKRLAKIRSGELTSDHHDPYASNTTTEQHNQTRKSIEAKITAYNAKLVQSYHQEQFKPLEQKFAQAVENCDVKTVSDCCEKFPFNSNAMTDVLKKTIHNQAKLGSLELAEFALDRGALQAFKKPLDKESIPFWVDIKNEKFNQDYTIGLVKKLGITPEAYFERAVKSKWPEHIKASLVYIESSPDKEKMKPQLLRAAEELRGNDYDVAADVITTALREQYSTEPMITRFDKAVERGDIEAVTRSFESFPVSESKLTEAFNSAVDAKHLPLAQFLADKGARVSKAKMASQLSKAIGNQGDPDALKLAEFAIDHGATEGFKGEPPKKEEFPFWVKLSDKNGVKEKFDQNFTIGLVKKLGVTPETYFKEAVEYRWEEHIKASLAYIESSDKKEQMRPVLERAAEELKAAHFTDRAELITAALTTKRDTETLVASVDKSQTVLAPIPRKTEMPKPLAPIELKPTNIDLDITPSSTDIRRSDSDKKLSILEATTPQLPPLSVTPSPIKRAETKTDVPILKNDKMPLPKTPPVLQPPKPTKVPKIAPLTEQLADNTPKPSDSLNTEQQGPQFLNEANPIKFKPRKPQSTEIPKRDSDVMPTVLVAPTPELPPISITPALIKRAETLVDLSMPKGNALPLPKKPAELKPLQTTPIPIPENTNAKQAIATTELKPRSVDLERKDKTKTSVVTPSTTVVSPPNKPVDLAAEASSKQMDKAIAAFRKLDIGRDEGTSNGSITTKVNGVSVPDGKIGINELAKISDKATSGYDWVQNEKSAAQQSRKALIAAMDLNGDRKTTLDEVKEVMKEAKNKGLSFDENALLTTLQTGSIPNKLPNPTLKK